MCSAMYRMVRHNPNLRYAFSPHPGAAWRKPASHHCPDRRLREPGAMTVDYSPFLSVGEDGKIWWQLTDAIKLGAGYLPVSDDDRELAPVLRAKNNRVRANERTLLSEFSQDHYGESHPRVLMRDGIRLVEAHEFLGWLSQYVAHAQSEINFPNALASAVQAVSERPGAVSTAISAFESLTLGLQDWFDRSLAELPDILRTRVEREFAAMPWEGLTAEQRHSVAVQLDYQRDPATLEEGKFWGDFFQRKDAIKAQLEQWQAVSTPTASDLALQEARVADLRQELEAMTVKERQARGDYYPAPANLAKAAKKEKSNPPELSPVPYIAYPKAMHQLATRLGATSAELAAWIFFGPDAGGIAAYLNANELIPPPRFFYAPGSGNQDYIAPLMACWFREEDIAQFEPADRYITGAALIERWSKRPGLHAVAFIQAKIAESRLLDIHPIYGGTRGTFAEHADWPPLEDGLFPVAHIEQIEAEDFAVVPAAAGLDKPDAIALAAQPCQAVLGSPEWRTQTAKAAANARHDLPGGSRDKQRQMRELWASGKYTSRDLCAEQECAALNMSISAARRALNNTPEPRRC